MCCAFQGYFRPSSIGYLLSQPVSISASCRSALTRSVLCETTLRQKSWRAQRSNASRYPADELFEAQRPHAVEVVVRVAAEGDHRLGAGDAGHLGYLLGHDLGEALEVRDADHDDEVVRAGDGVGFGDAFYAEHRLGRLLHPLPLRPDEHDGGYHAGPPL